MSDMARLTERILKFREERDWKQFHGPKDQAISLALEAAEVLEHFQWKSLEEANEYVAGKPVELAEELADVLYWVLIMAHDLDVDLAEVFEQKMVKNELKYPIDKAKGNHKKYTEHQAN